MRRSDGGVGRGDRDQEVVVVGDRNVVGAQSRLTATRVDVDRRGSDRDRPEQPGRGYPRLEVVDLLGRIADGVRGVQVNSYKAERPVVQASVNPDVGAAHEPHIAVEAVRRAVAPVGRALGLNPPSTPLKSVIDDISRPTLGGIT